jgi:5-methylcytosine-specific restriction endonuclease McrA
MTFSEGVRVAVRKRSHLRCCLCHSIGVDIHHIVPQAEGGSDEDENAAPALSVMPRDVRS